MMSKNQYAAKVGDLVCVVWANGESVEYTVRMLPQCPGDPWIMTTSKGDITYVMQYETIIVLNRKVI
jgi:hypothetical protein